MRMAFSMAPAEKLGRVCAGIVFLVPTLYYHPGMTVRFRPGVSRWRH
jgi:hypothetical protein